MELEIETPRWALPLQAEVTDQGRTIRYKGAWGGRGSGKSHEFAGMVVEEMAIDPNCSVVCIREIQKSLTLSAKKLIEIKIEQFGVGHLFEVLKTEIRRRDGTGLCIFQGMQDHTADSIKSLEGFRIAWVEEAQSLSKRSMELLRPTIRLEGSQIWFTWNPRRRSDPVERLLRGRDSARNDAVIVKTNYTDNPFLPDTLRVEADSDQFTDAETYEHVWLGAYESVGSKVVIPAAWVQSAIGLAEDLKVEISGKTYAGMDIAGAEEGGDENGFAVRKGIELRYVEKWNGLDTALTTQKGTRLAAQHGATEGYYDSVGVGEGVTGEWASMGRRDERPKGFEWFPWSGGAAVADPDKHIEPDDKRSPLNKNQYHNLKAQAWFGLRKRFENAHKARHGRPYDQDLLISIDRNLPHLNQVEEELTQPQQKPSATGKTMVDKQPDDAASPNLADAIVMAFWPIIGDRPAAAMILKKRHRK